MFSKKNYSFWKKYEEIYEYLKIIIIIPFNNF